MNLVKPKDLNDIALIGIFLLVISLPISPMKVDNILISSITLLAIVNIIKYWSRFKLMGVNQFYLIVISYFVIHVFGLIYSENISQGLMQVERKLSFLVFPLIFYSLGIKSYNHEKLLNIITYLFFSSLLIGAVICNINLFIEYGNPFARGYSILLGPLHIDPVYFSFYAVFSIFSVLIITFRKLGNLSVKKVLIGIACIYLTYFVLIVGSRSSTFVFAILSFIFLFKLLLGRVNRFILILSLLLFICTFIILVYQIPIIKARVINPILAAYEGRFHSLLNERIITWKCALETINLKMLIFGFGTGDVKIHVAECYEKRNLPLYFNSHNEYLSTLLRTGLLGLISLISNLLIGIFLYLKIKRNFFLVLAITLSIVFISESVLSRQKGVVFFNLFNCFQIFYFLNYTKNKLRINFTS